MAGPTVRAFERAEQARVYEHGRLEIVDIGGVTVARETIEPGWRWSAHLGPVVGTPSCRVHHVGVCVAGRMRVAMDDGREVEVGAGDAYDIPAGHDAWVVGDEPVVLYEISAGVGVYALPADAERVLVTLVFTDIVGSTALAERLGGESWRVLIAQHDRLARQEVERYRGRIVKGTGDGFLAAFDGAGRAVRCAAAVRSAVERLGVTLRCGVHTGEVEEVAGQLQGLAIHTAARVLELAQPGEVLVSSTTRDLVGEVGLPFEERGTHELRGLTGDRALFALVGAGT